MKREYYLRISRTFSVGSPEIKDDKAINNWVDEAMYQLEEEAGGQFYETLRIVNATQTYIDSNHSVPSSQLILVSIHLAYTIKTDKDL